MNKKNNTDKYIFFLIIFSCTILFVNSIVKLYYSGEKFYKGYYQSNRFSMILDEIAGISETYFNDNGLIYNEETKKYELSPEYLEKNQTYINEQIENELQKQNYSQDLNEDTEKNSYSSDESKIKMDTARSNALSNILNEQIKNKYKLLISLEAYKNMSIVIEYGGQIIYKQGEIPHGTNKDDFYFLEISNDGGVANEKIGINSRFISNSYESDGVWDYENSMRYNIISRILYNLQTNEDNIKLSIYIDGSPEEFKLRDRVFNSYEDFKNDLFKTSLLGLIQFSASIWGIYILLNKRKKGYLMKDESFLNKNKNESFLSKILWFISKLKLEIKIILFIIGLNAFTSIIFDIEYLELNKIIYQLFGVALGILTLIDFANSDNESYIKNSFFIEKRNANRKKYFKGIAKGTEIFFDLIFIIGAFLILSFIYYNVSNNNIFNFIPLSLIGGTIILFLVWKLYLSLFDERMVYIDEINKALSEIISGNVNVRIEEKDNLFGELTKNINKLRQGYGTAMEEKMKSERMKTELITNVSHDLKTPLTSIMNYVDLLKKENIKPEYAQDYVKILEQKTQRLNILIQDLFEASKAASGDLTLDMEQLDISQLLKQTLAELDTKIKTSGLNFVVNIPKEVIYIIADGKKLHRIFDNLIMNSLKYSLAGTRVYIELEKKDKLIFSIKNIANYEMTFDEKAIMQRFVRGDESRTGEGSGLGLAIAKSLAERMNMDFDISRDGDLFKAEIKMDFKK